MMRTFLGEQLLRALRVGVEEWEGRSEGPACGACTPGGRWRLRALVACFMLALAFVGGCGGGLSSTSEQIALRVTGPLVSPRFFVDDVRVAARQVGAMGWLVEVPAGVSRLRIELPGHLDERRELDITSERSAELRVEPWPRVDALDASNREADGVGGALSRAGWRESNVD